MLLLRDRELGMRKSEIMEWELRHSAGPPSASCFGYLSHLCERAKEARADCCWADCTELYKSESNVGQTTENAVAFSKALLPECETSGTGGRFIGEGESDPVSGLQVMVGSFRKTERETTISPVLGRVEPAGQRIYKDLAGKSVWNADCSIQGCSSLAPLRGAERRTSSGD